LDTFLLHINIARSIPKERPWSLHELHG